MTDDDGRQGLDGFLEMLRENWLRVVALLVIVATLAYFLSFYLRRDDATRESIDPALTGLVFLVFVYATFVLLTGRWRIWLAINGAAGSASTSKFQFFVWTGVVLFAYVAVAAALFRMQGHPELPALPPSVIIVLGLSSGTAAAAKILTVSNINAGKRRDKTADATTDDSPQRTDFGPLFLASNGQPDVGKIQLLGFTFLAMAVFLTATFELVTVILEGEIPETSTLPPIDDMLLVLMGFGSATYVGTKWILSPKPSLAARAPDEIKVSAAASSRQLTITGANFGKQKEAVRVMLDGLALETPLGDVFSDSNFVCTVPKQRPDGKPWMTDEKEVQVDLTVSVAGRVSQDTLSLKLAA